MDGGGRGEGGREVLYRAFDKQVRIRATSTAPTNAKPSEQAAIASSIQHFSSFRNVCDRVLLTKASCNGLCKRNEATPQTRDSGPLFPILKSRRTGPATPPANLFTHLMKLLRNVVSLTATRSARHATLLASCSQKHYSRVLVPFFVRLRSHGCMSDCLLAHMPAITGVLRRRTHAGRVLALDRFSYSTFSCSFTANR